MEWPDDLSTGLPAPRDDEPARLRQDILDELHDHLQCGLRREKHLGRGDDEALRNVLARFGDPARVAARLWFDAMKERIMSQRIMLVLSTLMTVTCLAVAALAWKLVGDNRVVNAALIGRLERIESAPDTPALDDPAPNLFEWVPVQVELVLEGAEPRPAAGFTVILSGKVLSSGKDAEVREHAPANGIVDLGLIRPGEHQLTLRAPWEEVRTQKLVVPAGSPHVQRIVCPSTAPPIVEVDLHVDWPAAFREQQLWLACVFKRARRGRTGPTSGFIMPGREITVLLHPGGERFLVDAAVHLPMSPPGFDDDQLRTFREANDQRSPIHFPDSQSTWRPVLFVSEAEHRAPEQGLKLLAGAYHLSRVFPVAAVRRLGAPSAIELEGVPLYCGEVFVGRPFAGSRGARSLGGVPEDSSLTLSAGDEPNAWSIPIPEDTLAMARRYQLWSQLPANMRDELVRVLGSPSNHPNRSTMTPFYEAGVMLSLDAFQRHDVDLDGTLTADEFRTHNNTTQQRLGQAAAFAARLTSEVIQVLGDGRERLVTGPGNLETHLSQIFGVPATSPDKKTPAEEPPMQRVERAPAGDSASHTP